jgi:hypothetical protein
MDERAFGKMEAQIEELERRLDKLTSKMDTLIGRLESLELIFASAKFSGYIAVSVFLSLVAMLGWLLDRTLTHFWR